MKFQNAGQFKRGKSGNPSGKAAGTKDNFYNVKTRLESLGYDVIGAIAEMAQFNADAKIRLKAAGMLLDRIAPALRSIEHTGETGTLFTLQIQHPPMLDAIQPNQQALQSEQNNKRLLERHYEPS